MVWLVHDKLIKLGNSHDMGIREKLQVRNSHILKGNYGINQYEKEKKMLVDSRWCIQEYICICIELCNI